MASYGRDQREGPAVQARASIMWPLQQLPVQVAEAVVARLPSEAKQQLRLTCKAAQALVDASTQQLTVKPPGPFKSGVAARFPQLAALQLMGTDAAAYQGLAEQMFCEPFTGVTSLTLHHIAHAAAMAAVHGCLNVKQCSVRPAQRDAQGATALVRNICSKLPSLSSLTISDHMLGDVELAALSSCASLVHLDVQLGPVGAAGWAAFMALPVASLKAELSVEVLPADALISWQSGMSALTALTVTHRVQLGAEQKLCLPRSIQALTMHSMQCSPSTVLPHLTKLTSPTHMLDAIRHLSRTCTAVVSLDLADVVLDLRVTPMHLLKELVVSSALYIQGGASLARTFPQLQHLSCPYECDVLYHSDSWLHGITSLASLDLGFNAVEYGSPVLWANDFAALSACAALHVLDLYALPSHVQGVALLHNLHTMTWSFERGDCNCYEGVAAAFDASSPPQQMHSATFNFLDDECDSSGRGVLSTVTFPLLVSEEYPDAVVGAQNLARAVDSAVSWLLRAPHVQHIWWGHHAECASLTNSQLAALASHASIMHIELQGGTTRICPAMLQHLRHLHTSRGLRITN